MTMFNTKFPNTSRTVSGATAVFNTDSILEVDTTTTAATINLDTIASGYWNTIWKLYVFDKSNNASVNNITINAGVGQTINGQSSLVINSNGGGVLIRVISNTKFLGSLTIVNSSGLTLTTTGTSGASTLVGSTLNIPIYSGGSGIIQLTNAAMLTLIGLNTVVVGQLYQITDAIINTGDLGVIVTGTTINSISSNGTGLFFNADYQGVGNYQAIAPTYSGTNLKIWYSSYLGPISIGDVVIWNNQNWVNISGLWGGSPSSDPTNWLVLSRSLTTGYILAEDFVSYNVTGNRIYFRLDSRGNQVTLADATPQFNSLKDFQWGRNKNTQNIISGYSNLIGMINSSAIFRYNCFNSIVITDTTSIPEAGNFLSNNIASSTINIVRNKGLITNNTITSSQLTISTEITATGQFSNNNLATNATVTISTLTGTFQKNALLNSSSITCSDILGIIQNCYLKNVGSFIFTNLSIATTTENLEISDNNTVTLSNITANLANFTITKGYSDWEITLDGAVVVTGTTLNLISTYSYVGVFRISNITLATTIDTITNFPTNHSCILKPAETYSFRIVPIAVGVAIADQIIETSSTTLGGTAYVSNTNSTDEAILKKTKTSVGLTIKNIWI